LHAVLTLLYFGMLTYRTDKLVVEWCLPAESWGVTVAMNVSENMHIVKADVCRTHMLYYNIVDFIVYCCRFFIDFIFSYCLRIYIKFFQGIHKFSFLGKMLSIHDKLNFTPVLVGQGFFYYVLLVFYSDISTFK
jgi:hypothetical protein